MPYSTQADLEHAAGGAHKLVQLADHNGDGVLDAATVTAAIAEADAEIGVWTRKRWTDSIPLTVKALSARMAVRVLRRNRTMLTGADVEQQEFDTELLKAIAKGDATAIDENAEASSMVVDKAFKAEGPIALRRKKFEGFS